MKKLIFMSLLFLSIQGFSQTFNTANKYYRLGYEFNGIKLDSIFVTPSDTTRNKLTGSVVVLNGQFYFKTSTKWVTFDLTGFKLRTDSIIKSGFTSRWRAQHQIDSLSALKANILVVYEIEVTTAGVSTYSVPFILRTNTQVFYNGVFLFSGRWWGSGTTSLILGIDTAIKDKINIIN